jgi:tetratricopeptide (TPR) repeat protein
MASVFQYIGDFERALEWVKKAIEADNKNETAHEIFIVNLLFLDCIEEAVLHISEAVHLGLNLTGLKPIES